MAEQETYTGTADQNRKIASTAYWIAAIGVAIMIAAVAALVGWVAAAGVLGGCMFVFGLAAGFQFDKR